jgi:hypothetical protein
VILPRANDGLGRALREAYQPRMETSDAEFQRLLDQIP